MKLGWLVRAAIWMKQHPAVLEAVQVLVAAAADHKKKQDREKK